MEAYMITDNDFRNKGTSSLPDRPSQEGLRAGEIKTKMDELVTTVVKARFNELIDALSAPTAAALLGALAADGVTPSTVRERLNSLQSQLQEVSQGAVADGSVTDAKLSSNETDLLARFGVHAAAVALHATDLGVTEGSGSQYTAQGTLPSSGRALFMMQTHAPSAAGAALKIGSHEPLALVTSNGQTLSEGRLLRYGVYLLLYQSGVPGTFTVLNPEPSGTTHSHYANEIIGLTTELAGKAPAVHSHSQADVADLTQALANKAAADHQHSVYATLNHTHNTLLNLQITGGVQSGVLGVTNVYITDSETAVPADAPEGTLVLRLEA